MLYCCCAHSVALGLTIQDGQRCQQGCSAGEYTWAGLKNPWRSRIALQLARGSFMLALFLSEVSHNSTKLQCTTGVQGKLETSPFLNHAGCDEQSWSIPVYCPARDKAVPSSAATRELLFPAKTLNFKTFPRAWGWEHTRLRTNKVQQVLAALQFPHWESDPPASFPSKAYRF